MKRLLSYSIWLLPISLIVLYIVIFASAGDGWYRYPCQDPDNWGKEECILPICDAGQTCSAYLIERTNYEGK